MSEQHRYYCDRCGKGLGGNPSDPLEPYDIGITQWADQRTLCEACFVFENGLPPLVIFLGKADEAIQLDPDLPTPPKLEPVQLSFFDPSVMIGSEIQFDDKEL